MRFRIDLKIFLFIILFCISKQIEIYIIMIIFAFLHEIGHLIAGLILRLKPEKIEIIPVGLTVSFKVDIEGINKKKGNGNMFVIKEIIVAIAGPIVNLFIFIITSLNAEKSYLNNLIMYSNLLIFIFNLIPIYPLDGGRILKGILHIIFGKRTSCKITYEISIISNIILTAICSIAILYYKNIAIFLIVAYVWIILIREINRYNRIKKIMEH